MSEAFRRSPLYGRQALTAPDGAARLAESPFLGKLVLRGDPGKIGEGVRAATGVDLPAEACLAADDGETAILWIGPDEYWIVAAPGAERDLAFKLGTQLATTHHQIVDVTDYYTAIALGGPRAREMLMKLTTLDLHARAFREGHVAGSMFGRTQATLWQRVGDDGEDGPAFVLLVRWSMADYLWCVLADAGREFGLPSQEPISGETWRLAR